MARSPIINPQIRQFVEVNYVDYIDEYSDLNLTLLEEAVIAEFGVAICGAEVVGEGEDTRDIEIDDLEDDLSFHIYNHMQQLHPEVMST